MPRLGTASVDRQSYFTTLKSLVSGSPTQPRKDLARSLLLRSVRLRIVGGRHAYSEEDEEGRLDGMTSGTIPLRVRPAFVVLNTLCLVFLGVLGFHPRGQGLVPLNDKILHFVCFLFATGLFYCIWDVDEPARRVWFWRNIALILTWVTCFAAGGLGSEMVQSLLPYKIFSWGDVVANLLGSGLGLFFSYHFERRYRTRREIARLYEPLDQELYGDEDEDDEYDRANREGDEEALGRNIWKSAESPSRMQTADGRKVRFGEEEIVPQQQEQEPHHSQSTTRPADLFRIDDDEDNDAADDVWRDSSSNNTRPQ